MVTSWEQVSAKMMSKNAQVRSKLLEIARILWLVSARTQICVLTVCQQQRWQVLEHCANSRVRASVGTDCVPTAELSVPTLEQRPWRGDAVARGAVRGRAAAHTAAGGSATASKVSRRGPAVAGIQQSKPEQVNRGKQRKVEYERPYPERTTEQERRGEGPDRPKRKRVDGNVCYANSGEGSKRRCDATGRPPGRPPG